MHTYLKFSVSVLILFITTQPLLAQSSSQPDGEPYVVDLTALDYAFGIEEEIPSGWVTFRMVNKGKEEHVALIYKMADSLSLDQTKELIGTFMESGNYISVHQQTQGEWGGPGLLSSGLTGETTVKLEPGVYLLFCGVKTPQGDFHYQKGMLRAFEVKADSVQKARPETDVHITLENYSFTADQPISAGEQTINLIYKDRDNHDLHVAALAEGQELDDVREWIWAVEAPSPFHFLGGAEQLAPGNESSFTVNLKPGRYAFACHVHAAWGEIAELTIPESGKGYLSSVTESRGDVIIEAKEGGLSIPEQLKSGQWNFVIQNSTDTPQFYLMHKMEKGKGVEEFIDYMENTMLKGRYVPGRTTIPFKRLPLGLPPVLPGQQKEVSLKIYEGSYVLMGPLAPGVPFSKAWDRDILHEFGGNPQ